MNGHLLGFPSKQDYFYFIYLFLEEGGEGQQDREGERIITQTPRPAWSPKLGSVSQS